MNLDPFLASLRDALLKAARADAAVRNIEDRAKVVFSEQFILAGTMPAAKAGHFARSSEAYRAVMSELAAARDLAGDAKAEAEYLTKRWDTWRTQQATARTKMAIGEQ